MSQDKNFMEDGVHPPAHPRIATGMPIALGALASGGAIIECFGVASDITERKQRGDALREADRRTHESLAMLVHELRSPLASIQNVVKILKRLNAPEPTAQKALEIIERQSNQMACLINHAMDATRIAHGKMLLSTERVDLVEIVRHAVEDCRGLLEGDGLAIITNLPAEPVSMQGDPTRLRQVICNLLENARKFTDPGGAVTIALASGAAEAVVSVRDTGIGIAPAMLPRVFESFAQADRSRGGLGLGLALVKDLVELHGGRVEVESAGLGQGAEFRVWLATAVPGPGLAASPTEGQGRSRILLIEDTGWPCC